MKTSFLVISLCITIGLKAQDLAKHQWKNRLVLIFVDDTSTELLNNQVNLLKNKNSELNERKLKVYQFSGNNFKDSFYSNWKESTLKSKNFFSKKEKFKVILIGLDGHIKHQQNRILSTKKLFEIIDVMPMRQNELQQNRK